MPFASSPTRAGASRGDCCSWACSRELADLLHRSRSRALIFWPEFKGIDFAGILAACDAHALEHLESLVVCGESGASPLPNLLGKPAFAYRTLAGSAPLTESRAAPDSGCVIFTTSGTTKAPKFVLHDQRTVIMHAFDVASGFSIDSSSTLLLAPPLCGVFGFCSAMAAMTAGCPLVITPAWNAEQAARDLVAHRVTHANGTDEAFAQLLDLEVSFSNARFFGYAAFNPAHGDIVRRAEARGLKLVGLYGTSEIQALFARQDENAPAAERRLAGGRPVSPAEIEAVVQEAPGIEACQVVGVPRAAGLAPVAFVILKPGAALNEPAVIAHVAARLARHKVPTHVFPVDLFPVTPGANATKIQKGKLREMAMELLA